MDHVAFAHGAITALVAAIGEVERSTGVPPVVVGGIEVVSADVARDLEVTDDRLHAMSHLWAIETSSPVEITVMDRGTEVIRVEARVAEPGPLVAMKLQSVQDRGSAKEGTDLLDIVRLTLDSDAGVRVRVQLGRVDAMIARDCAEFVNRVLLVNPALMARKVHRAGGTDVTPEDIEDVAAILLDACGR